ncbi:MAG TPA: hypothetical protein VFX89_02715 [Gammaproteobacteria bacterium]|nr:hypothetical protein [Gammaproteobacteria bacterium]
MRTTRLQKIMDWIAIVDVAILIVATVALLAGSPELPFSAPAPVVTVALAGR